MKKLYFSLLVLASLARLAQADETVSIPNKYHRFFVEPDFSVDSFNSQETDSGDLKSSGQQFGLKIGYEFLKPDSFYTELSLISSFGNSRSTLRLFDGSKKYRQFEASRNTLSTLLGYTNQIGELSLVYFSGLGLSRRIFGKYPYDEAYIPYGLKTQFPIIKNFVFAGVKIEWMKFIYYQYETSKERNSGYLLDEDRRGIEISFPIQFFGKANWYTSIEPYYVNLYKEQEIFGGRVSATRQF